MNVKAPPKSSMQRLLDGKTPPETEVVVMAVTGDIARLAAHFGKIDPETEIWPGHTNTVQEERIRRALIRNLLHGNPVLRVLEMVWETEAYHVGQTYDAPHFDFLIEELGNELEATGLWGDDGHAVMA